MEIKKNNVINITHKLPLKFKDTPVEVLLETFKRDIEEIQPSKALYILVKTNKKEETESITYDYAGMDDDEFISALERIKQLFIMKKFNIIDED